MVADTSKDFTDTWDFVFRRIQNLHSIARPVRVASVVQNLTPKVNQTQHFAYDS
jgi:hypothetical protein